MIAIRFVITQIDTPLLTTFKEIGSNGYILGITTVLYTLLSSSIFGSVSNKRVKVIQSMMEYYSTKDSKDEIINNFVKFASIKIHTVTHFFMFIVSLIITSVVIFSSYKSDIESYAIIFIVGFLLELFRSVTSNLDSVLSGKCYGNIPDDLVNALKKNNRTYNRIFWSK